MEFNYCFEGVVHVVCTHCKREHSLVFSGGDGDNIQSAINDTLIVSGWDRDRVICPDCFEMLGPAGDDELGDSAKEEDENSIIFDDILDEDIDSDFDEE